MSTLFQRWGPPVIGVAFASGLQLSGAVQHAVGWVLIGLSVIGAVIYVLISRRQEGQAEGKADLVREIDGMHPPQRTFINAHDVEGLSAEGNVVKGANFADLDNASDVELRGNVHDGEGETRS